MSERAGLAADLVAAAATAVHEIPEDVRRAARLHLLDSLGVGMLAARQGPLSDLARLATAGSGGACTVLGSATTASSAVAALVNGSRIHSLEYDDTHVASVMHGSATLTPAALAAAEASGGDGEQMLAAYAVGWEVLVRMGLASPGTLQARGFQTTSAAGPFAAALVSVLVQGDLQHGVDALGIAGSQPGGTFAFLAEGATVKAVQPGWAAHSGLWAADLARAGVSGPSGVLDGEYGFYRLYADDPGASAALAEHVDSLGQIWHLRDAAYKLMPCCHFIHPFVEAVDDLVADGLRAEDVATLHCHVPAGAVPVIAEPWEAKQRPSSGHDVRWSLPYVLAARLTDGEVGMDLFEAPIGGARAELAARISYETWSDSSFPSRYPARVEVTTTDGRVMRAEVTDVLGGAGRPVSEDAVRTKALRNLRAAGMGMRESELVVEVVLDAPWLDLPRLSSALRGEAA